MESYRDFARVYDEFMDQTPYDEWLLNILNIFKEYKIDKDTQVLDLGCGTGKMARKLARVRSPCARLPVIVCVAPAVALPTWGCCPPLGVPRVICEVR